jgi:ATP-dependent DNA ligase
MAIGQLSSIAKRFSSSRTMASQFAKFVPIVEALRTLEVETSILDGEVVAVDQEAIPRFGLLQRFQSQKET